jgi:hypothetical protein
LPREEPTPVLRPPEQSARHISVLGGATGPL